MSSTVSVRYFAVFEDEVGMDHEEIDINEPQPLDQFLDNLIDLHPEIENPLESAAVAVNMETVKPSEATVSPGDEVALLPPFGGGARSNPAGSPTNVS